MGAELFHADGQTDMTKLTIVFRNFARAPKNRYLLITSGKAETRRCAVNNLFVRCEARLSRRYTLPAPS